MGACAADEPGCQDARVPGRAFGGRWAQRDGEWIRGGGEGAGVRQLATSDWEGEHLGRAGGQEGPMREATGNPVPVQGEDARPSYPWSPTLMPDGPISLRPTGSTPRLSTVDCPEGLRVCLSVRVSPSVAVHPVLALSGVSGSLSTRTEDSAGCESGPTTRTISPFPFQPDYFPGTTDIEAS